MQFSNLKSVLIGAAAAAVVIAVTGAASGSGVGAVFNLGRTNTVNATSRLTGSTRHPMLSVTNNGTGAALRLQVPKGKAPFTVNSSTQVANLNASLLGGLAPTQFVQGGGQSRSFGFTMSTASNATKTLLSVPGFGTLSASCGPDSGGSALVRFETGTHAMDDFTATLQSGSGFSTDDIAMIPNQTYLFGAAATGLTHGLWGRVILRYATGLVPTTHIAMVDFVAGVDLTACDFDASAAIGTGATGH